jgi:hypothetical protein
MANIKKENKITKVFDIISKQISKKDMYYAIILILLASIYIGLATEVEQIQINNILSTEIFQGNLWLNIPICIIIMALASLWWNKIVEDEDIRLYRFALVISLGFIVNFDTEFKFKNIIDEFDYQCFISVLLAILLIVIIVKFLILLFYLNKSKILKNEELKGFSTDKIENEDISENLKKYAEILVAKLKGTDLSKESFAIGITAEWGAGKTTFLNVMKKAIEKEGFAEIVEFNPWLCNSPEQLTQDFFATLRDKLSPTYSTLSKPISKYAKLLTKIVKPSFCLGKIELELNSDGDSLSESKEHLSEKLAQLPKKVVIMIDDTDRLEGTEAFEILRLIRNTADFKNVIYLATYDKEYVTEVLKDNKINNPSAYLEKIFQVEIHLQKIESSQLWKTLQAEIEKQTNSHTVCLMILDLWTKHNYDFVSRILTNYRQVKRFARQFTVYLDYLHKNKLIDELSIIDLFWIELLQTYDKRVYNILAKDPMLLLKVSNKGLIIKREILNDKDEKKEKSKWKEETERILKIIFEEEYPELNILFYNNGIDLRRMRLTENYFKYFTLKLSSDQISFEEMDKMLQSNNPEQIISEWQKNRKKVGSISFHLISHKITYFNKGNLKNYITAILYTALVYEKIWIRETKELLRNDNYLMLGKDASKIAVSWFEDKINNYDEQKLCSLTDLLNQLHERTEEERDYSLIIDKDTIEEYLRTIIKKLIDKSTQATAICILKNGYILNTAVQNCCVQFFTENGGEIYKQIAFDIIIEHFSKKEKKPSIAEFERYYKENFLFDNMTDDEITDYNVKMTRLFGDNFEENIETFKKECFN